MRSRSLVLSSFLAMLIASASCSNSGKSGDAATGQSETSAQASPGAATNASSLGANVKDLGPLVDLIDAYANELPRTDFDPGALAELLGKDPQKIFEWVRDRTWWAPYRGILRGAQGVMLDRVGSSLDRAVLLGDLLRRAGYTVRLAHAQLPEKQARELLSKVKPIPDQRLNPVAPRAVSDQRKQAMEAIAPGLDKLIDGQMAESKRRTEAGKALVRSEANQLLTMVQKNRKKADGADERTAVTAIQDHWWVEREDGDKWIAMDASMPDAKPGDALASASETSDWKPTDEAPSIPETDWHGVRIRVVVERYQAGATTESTVLEAVLRPAAVLERSITLAHMPMPWPDQEPDSKTDPNALKNAALWVNKWVPVLKVGDELIANSAFTEGGDLAPVSNDSAAGLGSAAAGAGTSIGDALGGGGEEAPSYATAEWIDYEIRVPGQPSQHLRRPVFDLLGPAKRAAKATDFAVNSDAMKLDRFEALWGHTDILLQPCNFTQEFVAHLATADIVASSSALRELSRERDPAKARQLAADIRNRVAEWGPLPEFALWRTSLGEHSQDWLIDRPNVLNYRVTESVSNSDGPTLRELIDVASNSGGVRRGATTKSFDVRVEQGVADTVAEMLALGSDLQRSENTASLFAALAADGSSAMTVNAHDATAARGLPWLPDATERIASDVESGFMAVVPKASIEINRQQHVGWWRVDPTSGGTIGVMDTGFHEATSEDSILRSIQRFLLRFKINTLEHASTLQWMAENGVRLTLRNRFDMALYYVVGELVTLLYLYGF